MKLKSEAEVVGLKFTICLIVLIAFVAVVILSWVYVGSRETSEEFYQRTTSVETKAAHLAMTEQLKTVTPGDILIMNMWKREEDSVYYVRKNPDIFHDASIAFNEFHVGSWTTGTPTYLGRCVKRIIRKSDHEWTDIIREALNK